MKFNIVAIGLLFLSAVSWAAPQKLVLKNQFGETSINFVQGRYLPLPGTSLNVIMATGTVTPTAATLVGIAGAGSLYINYDPTQTGSAKLWLNFGTITNPSWGKVGP